MLQTRSNSRLLLDDETGDVTLESAKGQTIAIFYGDGNIELKAPENISISAGKSINITAGENINVNAGMNILESAGATHSSIAGGMISQTAGLDYTLMAANIMNIASENFNYEANDIHKSAEEGIEVVSTKDYIQNSEETVHNLSGEKSHNA